MTRSEAQTTLTKILTQTYTSTANEQQTPTVFLSVGLGKEIDDMLCVKQQKQWAAISS